MDRMRDIYIKTPDGEPEYDGEEETESEDDRYQRDWENQHFILVKKSFKINNHGNQAVTRYFQ